MPPRTTDRSGAHHHAHARPPRLGRQPRHRGAGDRRAAQDPCPHPHEAGEKLGKGASLDDYEAITQQLLSYALCHFDTEEALMQACGYEHANASDAQRHQTQHWSFTQRVMAVRDDLKGRHPAPPDPLLGF